MMLEWDSAKNTRNIAARGLDFELATILFAGTCMIVTDTRRDYGETRLQATGVVGDAILVCIYTVRGEARRIISLRHANRRERNVYRSKEGL